MALCMYWVLLPHLPFFSYSPLPSSPHPPTLVSKNLCTNNLILHWGFDPRYWYMFGANTDTCLVPYYRFWPCSTPLIWLPWQCFFRWEQYPWLSWGHMNLGWVDVVRSCSIFGTTQPVHPSSSPVWFLLIWQAVLHPETHRVTKKLLVRLISFL